MMLTIVFTLFLGTVLCSVSLGGNILYPLPLCYLITRRFFLSGQQKGEL